MNNPNWHRERQTCLGGSEAPALVGLGYKDQTPLAIWQEKVSTHPTHREPNERMRLGTFLEPLIAERYTERTGGRLDTIGHQRHPERKWQGCTPDRISIDGWTLVEMKAIFGPPGEDWGEAGTDQIPERIIVQTQHQMGVCGAMSCDVAVLFVGYGFEVYRVGFDPALFNLLTTIEEAFWRHVEAKEPPPSDWSHPFTGQLLEGLQKPFPGKSILLGEVETQLVRQYEQLGDIISEAEADRKRVKAAMLAAMTDAERGVLPDGQELRRKTVRNKGYTVEPFAYERLTIHQPKKAKVK